MLDRFITISRVEGYPKLMAALFALIASVWTILSLPNLIDPMGKPIGYDFMAFWSGGRMALDGDAALAYDPMHIIEAHRLAVPGVETFYLWHYPPTYFLLTAPLGAMPYLLAFAMFVGASLWAWKPVALAAAPDKRALWAIAALPAGLICLMHGQNGFLTAALVGGALLLLDKRPYLAGVLIGILVIKPHLAVLFPIALLAIGQWRAIASAAATAAALIAMSILAFGLEPWRAFIENLPLVKGYVDSGWLPWGMMPTTYVFARSLDLSPQIAQILHGAVALAAAAAVWIAWRRTAASFESRAAVFAAASLLISPYLFYYDLVLMGLVIAWLAFDGVKTGAFTGERPTLALAWFMPLLMNPLNALLGVQLGVFVTIALLGFAMARALGRTPALASGWTSEPKIA
ncbi:MAG: DUF2029 domain-containing protein [Alphaproteobacteria bacterium]|nr:DUF2029 domain-containing protein [Alphaproteobacteria bacterium]